MIKSYKSIKSCRLCDSKKITKVLDFGKVPLANSLVKKRDLKEKISRFRLQNNLCRNCGHLQLSISVNPKLLFSNYLYLTNTSSQNLKHFKKYSKSLREKYLLLNKKKNIKKRISILDVASNDGSFLNFFKKKEFKRLGVDPAKNLKRITEKKGIQQLALFFNYKQSQNIKKKYGTFEIISANHVCAHVENLRDFFLGIKNLLKENGIFSFEVSYRGSVLKKNTFDTIYHEHIDYHSLKPLKIFINSLGLEIFDFDLNDAQGGSIRIYVSRQRNNKVIKKIKNQIIFEDKILKMYNIQTYKQFMKNILKIKEKINIILKKMSKKNKIFGYGAAAKSTTLLNFFKINSNLVSYVADDNRLKIGKIIPGTKIPIIKADHLKKYSAKVIVIFAWNYAENIMKNCNIILNYKKKFIIPFPKVKKI